MWPPALSGVLDRIQNGAGSAKIGSDGSFRVTGPSPWVDVKAYGATGDGTTDDTAAIQAAIDALPDTEGGIVFIPVGVYAVTDTIELRSNITVLGVWGGPIDNGAGNVNGSQLLWDGATGGTVLSIVNAEYVAITGLNVNGGGIAGVTGICIDSNNDPASHNISLRQISVTECGTLGGAAGTQGVGIQIGTTGLYVTNAAISSGTDDLTSAAGSFDAGPFSPNMVGLAISVSGAGPAAATLNTTVLAYVSPTQVQLATNASTTATNATALISGAQCDGLNISQFYINACARGIWINSANGADYSTIENGQINAYNRAIDVNFGAYLSFRNITFGGAAVTTLNNVSSTQSCFWFEKFHSSVLIEQCQGEGSGNTITVSVDSPSDTAHPITLISNHFDLPSDIRANRRIVSIGNYYAESFTLTAASIEVASFGDQFAASKSFVRTGANAKAVDPLAKPFARLRKATAQTIGTSAVTAITLDTDDTDTDALHFTSASNLTGTVAKNGTATLTGSGTSFTSELSVGQVISVPGTAAEKRVVIDIASNTSLTVSSAFTHTASGQTATRVNTAAAIRTPGNYRLTGVIQWTASASGARRIVQIQKNGTTAIANGEAAAVAGVSVTCTAVTTIALAQWDYVELVAYQDTGGDLDVLGSASHTPVLTLELV